MNLNEKSFEILEKLKGFEGVEIMNFETDAGRATVLDLGVNSKIVKNQDEIGISVAEASMGGLGRVFMRKNQIFVVIEKEPAIATLSCQMSGWGIEIRGKKRPGTGPARILARKPSELIDRIGYHEISEKAALIIETNALPDEAVCREILEETEARELIIAALREGGRIGLINIAARIIEVGLYRLDKLAYDVRKIISANGCVPIPKLTEDVMFSSNDAIIYGGQISMKVNGWDSNLTELSVSTSSKAYGKEFKSIFREAGGDLYRINPDIFAPAEIRITDVRDGKQYHAGRINNEILKKIM